VGLCDHGTVSNLASVNVWLDLYNCFTTLNDVDRNFLSLTDNNDFAPKIVFTVAPNIFSTVIGDSRIVGQVTVLVPRIWR